jgi:hypothetical protein
MKPKSLTGRRVPDLSGPFAHNMDQMSLTCVPTPFVADFTR